LRADYLVVVLIVAVDVGGGGGGGEDVDYLPSTRIDPYRVSLKAGSLIFADLSS
jgi:hypothetical protein